MERISRIILASSSPRRRELLSQMGLSFETVIPKTEEKIIKGESPREQVKRISRVKAEATEITAGDLVISADTVVTAHDGEILGKPKDEPDALRMLMLLSGKTHSVYTGVTLMSQSKTVCFACESKVTFRNFDEDEAKEYILTGEPMDKAGAYGIQGKGGMFAEKIEGDFFNIVGLPICRLKQSLCQFNISVL